MRTAPGTRAACVRIPPTKCALRDENAVVGQMNIPGDHSVIVPDHDEVLLQVPTVAIPEPSRTATTSPARTATRRVPVGISKS